MFDLVLKKWNSLCICVPTFTPTSFTPSDQHEAGHHTLVQPQRGGLKNPKKHKVLCWTDWKKNQLDWVYPHNLLNSCSSSHRWLTLSALSAAILAVSSVFIPCNSLVLFKILVRMKIPFPITAVNGMYGLIKSNQSLVEFVYLVHTPTEHKTHILNLLYTRHEIICVTWTFTNTK